MFSFLCGLNLTQNYCQVMCVCLCKKIPNSSPECYHFTCPWCGRVPVVWHPLYLIWLVFLILAILMAMCGFHLHFPVAYDTDHLVMCLLAIHSSSFTAVFAACSPLLLGCLIIELQEFCKSFVTYVPICFSQTVACLFLGGIFS